MPLKTTKVPAATVEIIRKMAMEGKSGRVIALHLELDHRRVAKIIRDILQISRATKKKAPPSEALARPVASAKWEEMRRAERIVPRYIPHVTATMHGRYVPKELEYRGMRA